MCHIRAICKGSPGVAIPTADKQWLVGITASVNIITDHTSLVCINTLQYITNYVHFYRRPMLLRQGFLTKENKFIIPIN